MKQKTPPSEPHGTTWRFFMNIAFEEACKAAHKGESPVGAALFTLQGDLIAKAHNVPIALNDPTGHAEILCLRKAAKAISNYRLPKTFMAVTLEPCLMCTGALIHSRVDGLLIGALDSRAGAITSNLQGASLSFTNHRMWHLTGIMEEECSSLLTRFFLNKRKS